MDLALTSSQEDFALHDAKYPALIAGLGCIHGDTRIWTEKGLIRISDITNSIRVLSWNEKDQKFQLSASTGSFPKGKENLFLVSTEQGEFRAAGHHRIFSYLHKYEYVHDLTSRYGIASFSRCQLSTILESCLLSCQSDDLHCSQKVSSYLQNYGDECRRYGQQFLKESNICQELSQESAYAHKLTRKSGLFSFVSEGDWVEKKLKHIHPYLSRAHKRMKGYLSLALGLVEVSVNYIFSLLPEHILHYHQQVSLSRAKFSARRIKELFYFPCHSFDCSPSKTLIISCNREDSPNVYYDIHVLETNNYVCENGFIHHNSGKSFAATARLIIKMLEKRGTDTAYYLPTYDLLKLRILPGVEDMLSSLGLKYVVNKSNYTIQIAGFGKMILRSFDNPARIVAYEVSHSIIDELDTIPKDQAAYVWRKVSERNRKTADGTIAVVTTPDQGFSGFIYHKWVKSKQDGYEIIKAKTTDNPFLPDGYVDQIRDNYDPIMADMYINGEFCSLSRNKVYHFFDRKKHHTSRQLTDADKIINVGIDFNVGGCCATVWVVDDNKPVAVDEFVSHDTQDFCNNLIKYNGRKVIVHPDASGKARKTNSSRSDIDIIVANGHKVDMPNMNPSVRDRVNCVNSLLAHDKILVNTDKCQNLCDALESQGYDKKGEPEKFDDHPGIDDWVDGAGYFLHRKFPITRPSSQINVGGIL